MEWRDNKAIARVKRTIEKRRFGARLQDAREAKGWSQRALARKLGVSNQAVSDWEKGVYLPQNKHIVRAGYALGVDLTEEES
jgi:transcriptional regulator with XRE-family HTH domain